jgi:hypothetical protein
VASCQASVSRSGTRPRPAGRGAHHAADPSAAGGCFPPARDPALKASSWHPVVVPGGGFDKGLPGRKDRRPFRRRGLTAWVILAAVAPTSERTAGATSRPISRSSPETPRYRAERDQYGGGGGRGDRRGSYPRWSLGNAPKARHDRRLSQGIDHDPSFPPRPAAEARTRRAGLERQPAGDRPRRAVGPHRRYPQRPPRHQRRHGRPPRPLFRQRRAILARSSGAIRDRPGRAGKGRRDCAAREAGRRGVNDAVVGAEGACSREAGDKTWASFALPALRPLASEKFPRRKWRTLSPRTTPSATCQTFRGPGPQETRRYRSHAMDCRRQHSQYHIACWRN